MRSPTPGKSFGRAQRMRKALSPPEARLWKRLKGQPQGTRWLRQHPEGVYILDFYCPDARLCVEVDGWTHERPEQAAHDARRDAWLADRGIETLRLLSGDVMAAPDHSADLAITRAHQRIATRRTP